MAILSNLSNCSECNFCDFVTFEYLAFTTRAQQHILVVSIYRPPKPNSAFLSQFSDLLSIVIIKYDKVLLLGDFNFHINDSSDVKVCDFLDLVTSLNCSACYDPNSQPRDGFSVFHGGKC